MSNTNLTDLILVRSLLNNTHQSLRKCALALEPHQLLVLHSDLHNWTRMRKPANYNIIIKSFVLIIHVCDDGSFVCIILQNPRYKYTPRKSIWTLHRLHLRSVFICSTSIPFLTSQLISCRIGRIGLSVQRHVLTSPRECPVIPFS